MKDYLFLLSFKEEGLVLLSPSEIVDVELDFTKG